MSHEKEITRIVRKVGRTYSKATREEIDDSISTNAGWQRKKASVDEAVRLLEPFLRLEYDWDAVYPEIRSKHPKVRRLRLAMDEVQKALAVLEVRDAAEAIAMCDIHKNQGTLDRELVGYVMDKLP